MRKLLNDDMYLLSEIFDKMEIEPPNIEKFVNKKEEKVYQLGMEIMFKIFRKIHKAKNEINKLIQSVFEKTDEEMKGMTFEETKDCLLQLWKMEDVRNFIKS